jgi:hypothetical protein
MDLDDDYMTEMHEGETRLVVRIDPEEAIPVVAA